MYIKLDVIPINGISKTMWTITMSTTFDSVFKPIDFLGKGSFGAAFLVEVCIYLVYIDFRQLTQKNNLLLKKYLFRLIPLNVERFSRRFVSYLGFNRL